MGGLSHVLTAMWLKLEGMICILLGPPNETHYEAPSKVGLKVLKRAPRHIKKGIAGSNMAHEEMPLGCLA